jgi:hypothetical protein
VSSSRRRSSLRHRRSRAERAARCASRERRDAACPCSVPVMRSPDPLRRARLANSEQRRRGRALAGVYDAATKGARSRGSAASSGAPQISQVRYWPASRRSRAASTSTDQALALLDRPSHSQVPHRGRTADCLPWTSTSAVAARWLCGSWRRVARSSTCGGVGAVVGHAASIEVVGEPDSIKIGSA